VPFVFIGEQPFTQWLEAQVTLDDDGHMVTGR
jgi:hypothetical protein